MRTDKRGFWAWLVGLFSPKQKNPLVVRIEEGLDGDESAIPSLSTHPGFLALVAKLRRQRAALEAKLISSRHESLRDVDILVIGHTWLGFLESEVAKATKSLRSASTREASQHEVDEFEKIRTFIESVGTENLQ